MPKQPEKSVITSSFRKPSKGEKTHRISNDTFIYQSDTPNADCAMDSLTRLSWIFAFFYEFSGLGASLWHFLNLLNWTELWSPPGSACKRPKTRVFRVRPEFSRLVRVSHLYLWCDSALWQKAITRNKQRQDSIPGVWGEHKHFPSEQGKPVALNGLLHE